MLYLLYLEAHSPHQLVSALKQRRADVYIAADLDDLLDALWFHGSTVGRIVIETDRGDHLADFLDAMVDWPDLPVIIFGPLEETLGRGQSNLHFEKQYSLLSATRDVAVRRSEVVG